MFYPCYHLTLTPSPGPSPNPIPNLNPNPGKRIKAVLDKVFMATWLTLRLLWLPPLLVWLVLPFQVSSKCSRDSVASARPPYGSELVASTCRCPGTFLLWLYLLQVYPSLFRHIFCAACAGWLVALQFLWTWNFLVDPKKRVNLC